jgi:hypothetical protein
MKQLLNKPFWDILRLQSFFEDKTRLHLDSKIELSKKKSSDLAE